MRTPHPPLLTPPARAQDGTRAVAQGAEVAGARTVEGAEVVLRWSQEAWQAVTGWSVHTYMRTRALVLRLTGPARAVGEPDEDLLTWQRCRRCQLQFDPHAEDAEQACRFHPARWECGGGEPFALRHRKGAGCVDACEGRFPCCNARQRRDHADNTGCRSAGAHVAE